MAFTYSRILAFILAVHYYILGILASCFQLIILRREQEHGLLLSICNACYIVGSAISAPGFRRALYSGSGSQETTPAAPIPWLLAVSLTGSLIVRVARRLWEFAYMVEGLQAGGCQAYAIGGAMPVYLAGIRQAGWQCIRKFENAESVEVGQSSITVVRLRWFLLLSSSIYDVFLLHKGRTMATAMERKNEDSEC